MMNSFNNESKIFAIVVAVISEQPFNILFVILWFFCWRQAAAKGTKNQLLLRLPPHSVSANGLFSYFLTHFDKRVKHNFRILEYNKHLLFVINYRQKWRPSLTIQAFVILLKKFSGIWMLKIWKFVHRLINLANKFCKFQYSVWENLNIFQRRID